MQKKLFVIMLLVALFATGCVRNQPQTAIPSTPQKKITVDISQARYSDKTVEISLQPVVKEKSGIFKERVNSFALFVVNKSPNDLRLSWDDSYFIENGQAKGGFMFEGVSYANRDAPKKDLLVLPNSKVALEVFPTSRVMHSEIGWLHAAMNDGEYGGYFKLTGKNYQKQVKLIATIGSE